MRLDQLIQNVQQQISPSIQALRNKADPRVQAQLSSWRTTVMQLSDHFTLSELTKSSTAERLGIANEPGSTEVENLIMVCDQILEPVRNHYGIAFAPNSGFRCLELNRAIGSSDKSQHVTGQAVDFEGSGDRQQGRCFMGRGQLSI